MERNLLIAELMRINPGDYESKPLATATSKLIWLNNTQLGSPYSGGNFNFLYNSGANEATITFVAYLSYRAKYTDPDKDDFMRRLYNAIAAWDSAAELQIKDTSGNYATRIKLRFKLHPVINPKNANKKIEVHPTNTWASWFSGKNREITMREMNVYIGSKFKTLCHELGHVWGLEDEYDTKWIEKKFSPAHVGSGSPLLKDTTALLNKGEAFRGRYFKHFGRALLKAFAHIPKFRHPVIVNNKIVTYQVLGRIALLKNDINGGTPGNFTTLNPQFTPVTYAFRNKNRETAIDSEFDSEIFLPDDRIPVADEKLKPYSWVCKIRVRYTDPQKKAGGWSEGSGFLIGENCVLTNAHVILGKGKPATHTRLDKIEVTIGLNDSKKIAGPFETKSFQTHAKFGKEKPTSQMDIDLANSIWDYGIIKLKIPAKVSKTLKDLRYWGHTASESLLTIEKDKLKNIDGKSAGFKPANNTMFEAQGRLTFFNNLPANYNDRLIAHSIDTEHAQSGSPLWIEGTTESKAVIPILAGIHVAGNKGTNIGIRMSEEVLTEIGKMKRKLANVK